MAKELVRATTSGGLTVLVVSDFVHGRYGPPRLCPHCGAKWRIESERGSKVIHVKKNGEAAQGAVLVAFGNNAAVECCRWPTGVRRDHVLGFKNRHGQEVLRVVGQASESGHQRYVLRCGICKREYEAEYSEALKGKCPCHQGGTPGLPIA